MDQDPIAKAGLEIGAIKLSADPPFKWASGYFMPIYNDNRMFLLFPELKKMILKGFYSFIRQHALPDVIAGTATAGISWGSSLSDQLGPQGLPSIYVRDKPKSHGLKNRIEGIAADSDLEGKTVILIEDLISTGGSSVSAVQAIRDANGECNLCMSIFNYGFEKAEKMFKGEEPYEGETSRLDSPCEVKSLLTYDVLLETALDGGHITDEQEKMLAGWRADPWGWGEKHDFPRAEE